MSETLMEPHGIHLSLLDGMEEDLLLRLHQAGISTRDELEVRTRTPDARRDLARSLNVTADRIEAVHYLNFVFPSDQAIRLFQAERRADRAGNRVDSLQKKLNWLTAGFLFVWLATLVLGWVWVQTQTRTSSTAQGGISTEEPAASTEPPQESPHQEVSETALTASQARNQLMHVFEHLGPTPGWSGRLQWTVAQHEAIAAAVATDPDRKDVMAFSQALKALSAVENHSGPARLMAQKAQAAATELAVLPLPQGNSRWSVAALQVWLRLHSYSQGLANPLTLDLAKMPHVPWEWNSRGFLLAETRLARLRALPVSQEALPKWSKSLKKLQQAVNVGRDDLHPKPEAWAREIWLPKAQVELAVVGAISGAGTLAPYNNLSPKGYLQKRVAYIKRAYETSPPKAKAPMAWLYCESLEALELVAWLEAQPDIRSRAQGKVWVRAIDVLDQEWRLRDDQPGDLLQSALTEALALSGDSTTGVWNSPRTAWEASMRPLFVETRAALSRRQGS